MTRTRYSGRDTDFYVAPPNVAEVVNLAIDLNRPILVEGEPGCGKTMLAKSIAAELGLADRLLKISVKSTSRAQDLLYRMNALKRLQDAQTKDHPDVAYTFPYLALGPLGRAIHDRQRSVVLLDEIDKADIDFPNDLLDVLDDFSFRIDELPEDEEARCRERHGFGREVRGNPDALPIVVITSNREKRLPEPFLRRCLYVRVGFPKDAGELREIVRRNDPKRDLGELSDDLLNAMVVSFLGVRGLALGHTQKPPTTSELIDWVRILHWQGVDAAQLRADGPLPPQWRLLFKTMADLDDYEALAAKRQQAAA